ncbi:MAG: 3-dehydroquinate synthase [Verrucomicrobia bacterium]|nr:3-dehydroquinate synthase [Cytophagales bacterium]
MREFFINNYYTQSVVLADENTKKYCYPLIKQVLPKKHRFIQVKSGEENKNLSTCTQIWQQLTDFQCDRNTLVINLGGGVIGDMGGFCAATYKRGIDFIQVPTTLLAQVDASVGGKLGIDFEGFKNHIGVFELPAAIFMDTVFLKTLPEVEIRSGFAEIIKHCLIADATLWKKISQQEISEQNWSELVFHSVKIKENITKQDPTEKGLRKILNFGHTIGHAIESFCLSQPKRKVLHGEAIAAGMICETYLSVKKCKLAEVYLEQIEEFLFSTFGKIELKPNEIDQIVKLTLQDKKNKGGQINCVLLENIGRPILDQPISNQDIKEALEFYLS